MLDWSTPFPYLIISGIILIGVGIYALISAKKFIRIIFGVQILFLSSCLFLLSFSTSNNLEIIANDPLIHTLAIFILLIAIMFFLVGTAIDRQLRKKNKSTKIEFSFTPLDLPAVLKKQLDSTDSELHESEVQI